MQVTTKSVPGMTLLSATRIINHFSEVPPLAGGIQPQIVGKAKAAKLAAGPEIFIYKFLDGGRIEFLMGIPVREAKGDVGEFAFVTTPPVKVASGIHKGSMETIGQSWDVL